MSSITLQDTTTLVSHFFDAHPLPSFIVHAGTLQIAAANKKATSLLHYTVATLQAFTLFDLLQPKDKIPFGKQCRQAAAQEWKGAFGLLPQSGAALQVKLLVSPFSHKNQQYLQVVCTGPVEEKQLLELEEVNCPAGKIKLMASLVRETEDILTAADLEFKPVTWNNAAERIYGITAGQAIGSHISQVLHIEYVGTTRAAVREVIRQQGHWRGEMTFIRPTDNRNVTLITSFKQLHDEAGAHIGYLVCGTDITERKEDELKLKEIEDRFRGLADSAPVGIWMTDTENKLLYVNKTLLRTAEIGVDDFTIEAWVARLHPDDVPQTTTNYYAHFKQQQPVTQVYRLKRSSGEYIWMQDTGIPRFLEDGTFVGYIGCIVDISDAKYRQEQLQYQAWVLENVQDVVITTDLQFAVNSWNKAAEKLYGYTYNEVVGKPMKDLVQFDFESTTKEAAHRELAEKGIWKGEVAFTDKQGEKRYFLHTVSYFVDGQGNRTGILDVGREITDRKKAAEKLEQSELFYRNLIAGSLDGIFLCNADSIITFVSPSIEKILGWDAEEGIGKSCFDFVHPDDMGWAYQSFQNEMERKPVVKSIVIRLRKKDGGWLWCMVRGNNLLDNPHVKSMVIYFHDDTLRKAATEALKESERRFRSLISDLQVGVILNAPDGTTIMCNKTMCQMLMVPEEELIGKSIYEVLADDFIDEEGARISLEDRPLLRAMRHKEIVKDVVLGFRQRRTNERIWVLINSDPILDEKGEILHIICTVKEITDRKKLEQELLEKQISHQKALTQATIDGQEKERREIGKELHDNIGQQLTTTKLFLDMAKTTADDGTAEMVSLALKGVSDVINEVRSISHALVPPILGDIGVIESIEAMVENIRYAQLLKIDFDYFDFNEDRVPENQQLMLYRIIQEGLNNIVKHADATHVNIVIKNINKKLTLELKDNGKGFNHNKVRKGLGLTNIKNRAELFGGTVSIVSAPGAGCLLKVAVPHTPLPPVV